MITKLKDLIPAVKNRGKKRLVAAYANDTHTIVAIANAVGHGIVDATLVGDRATIERVGKEQGIDPSVFRIVQEEADVACVAKAIAMIHAGEADILMKGLVSTDKYMKGILNKETGLVAGKGVLTHVCVLEMPQYHKLLTITDVAVIPAPDLKQKVALTGYVVKVARQLGVEVPKVALIAPTEQMLPGIPSCVDAAVIAKMGERGQIPGALVDGPGRGPGPGDRRHQEAEKPGGGRRRLPGVSLHRKLQRVLQKRDQAVQGFPGRPGDGGQGSLRADLARGLRGFQAVFHRVGRAYR